jgi:UDP-N-acetylmuramyl pentapeptide phosphotransferase/UDP-N-acetylglucosamine-1-phosphate transferase
MLSFSLTYFIKEFYIKKSLVAKVNERSSHTIPTPHGGGIAIFIIWFIGVIYLYFNNQIELNLFYALLCGVTVSIVSFFDDLYELSPKSRLLVQSFSAILGLYFLNGMDTITFGFIDINTPIITNIFAFFMIIWFINLTNFIDGINGYVGSQFVFLSIAGFIFFQDSHFIILCVSVLGFLYWNWNKAKIFMGDVGSTLLGYNIAIFTIYYSNQEANNFWIWIILFSLFWFDATVTLIRRKLNNEKLSQAHKKHAYQRLTQSGYSHYKVTNYSIIMNIIIFCIIYFISNLLLSLFISLIMLIFCYLFIEQKKPFQ